MTREMVKKANVTAVVICVDYDDFLEVSLPKNMGFFNDFIVVTSSEDTHARQLCHRFDIEPVVTDSFWKNNSIFNKAAGLNEGLKHVKTDFICALDADVLLPDNFDALLASIETPDDLYGMNRVIYKTTQELHERVGEDRHMPPDYVIGFFQLFSRKSPYFPGSFNDTYKTGYHYDIEFMVNWPASHRKHLATIPLAHVGERAVNWAGRVGAGPDGKKAAGRTPLVGVESVKKIMDSSEKFKFTYLESSGILLLHNVSKQLMQHVRLNIKYADGALLVYRFGTMLAGNFVEIPVYANADNIKKVSVSAVSEQGSIAMTLPVHRGVVKERI